MTNYRHINQQSIVLKSDEFPIVTYTVQYVKSYLCIKMLVHLTPFTKPICYSLPNGCLTLQAPTHKARAFCRNVHVTAISNTFYNKCILYILNYIVDTTLAGFWAIADRFTMSRDLYGNNGTFLEITPRLWENVPFVRKHTVLHIT